MKIHDAFDHLVLGDERLVYFAQAFVRYGQRQVDLAERPVETLQVPRKVDKPPVEHGGDFVNGVAEQEAAVENGDFGVFLGFERAVHIDDAGHGRGPAIRKRRPV
ncbi:MAG: hypothetical protein A49_08780 [Methyloceanibacter sp.]|nr:MAG: hypothetical protein A49_08780 [Methyloceanibacter sp.]